jgi:DNA-binding XRE family transcriptional regulator
MDSKEFIQIRHYLGKTQVELAQLLGVSTKSIQSIEQGWRKIPIHTERQLLFILSMKRTEVENEKACWVIRKCPMWIRRDCPAWEFNAGHLCWFINGTICQGEAQQSWQKKMKLCRKCEVFRSTSVLPG